MGNLAPNKVWECSEHCQSDSCDHEKVNWTEGVFVPEVPNKIMNKCKDQDCVCQKFKNPDVCYCQGGTMRIDHQLDLCLCTDDDVQKFQNTQIQTLNNQEVPVNITRKIMDDLLRKIPTELSAGRLASVESSTAIVNERIPTNIIDDYFVDWVNNHPVYHERYKLRPLQFSIPTSVIHLPAIFERFLSSDLDQNQTLILSLLSDDGSRYEIHRLTPEQKIEYQTSGNFLQMTIPYKSCRLEKLMETLRKNAIRQSLNRSQLENRGQSKLYGLHWTIWREKIPIDQPETNQKI
jgi:hypothetical protein